mgnify:CR=1 FL=1
MVVGRSENPEVPVLFFGHNLPPLVKIRLTELPKFGGAIAPLVPQGTAGLYLPYCLEKYLNYSSYFQIQKSTGQFLKSALHCCWQIIPVILNFVPKNNHLYLIEWNAEFSEWFFIRIIHFYEILPGIHFDLIFIW